jgi:ankyrin repeat protein
MDQVGWISSSSQPTTVLALACAKAGPSLVRRLLDLKADVNLEPKLDGRKGATPLTAAVGANKTANVEVLLSRGANINRRGYDFMAGSM